MPSIENRQSPEKPGVISRIGTAFSRMLPKALRNKDALIAGSQIDAEINKEIEETIGLLSDKKNILKAYGMDGARIDLQIVELRQYGLRLASGKPLDDIALEHIADIGDNISTRVREMSQAAQDGKNRSQQAR